MPDLNIIISTGVFLLGGWNAWTNSKIRTTVLQMELNLKREFNGRYVSNQALNDVKERVGRLEEHEDSRMETLK